MQPPIIHIGVHKALSSWLQDQIFTPDGPIRSEKIRISEILSFLVPPRTVDITDPAWIVRIREAAESGLTVGVSAERLSGYPMLGLLGRREIAENIKCAFPNARILIITREQISAIQSYYYQYLYDGGSLGLDDFLHAPGIFANHRMTTFDFKYYEYSHLVDIYQTLFGAESVTVLPYELFMSDYARWRSIMETRLETQLGNCDPEKRVNTSRSYAELACHKWMNRLVIRTSLSNSGVTRSEVPRKLLNRYSSMFNSLSPKAFEKNIKSRHFNYIEEQIGSFYTEDNKLLGQQMDIDLQLHGYQ